MKKLIPLVAAAVLVAACGEPTDPEEHHEPAGVEIRQGSTVLVSYDGTTVTGQIVVDAGAETPEFDFVFLSDDGDELEYEDDTYLEIDVANESIAEAHYVDQANGVAHFDGVATGTTTFEVHLMHGVIGSGHPDFSTVPITIVVN